METLAEPLIFGHSTENLAVWILCNSKSRNRDNHPQVALDLLLALMLTGCVRDGKTGNAPMPVKPATKLRALMRRFKDVMVKIASG